jgi:hypothetical protein
MKNETSTRPFVVASLLVASLAPTQANAQSVPGGGTEPGAPSRLNQFRLSYRGGFNISATFKDTGSFSQANDPGPAVAGVDHNYDDGYNRVDSSGNLNNQTWYWGYTDSGQVPGDGFIYMHSLSSAPASAPQEESCSPQNGVELTYNRHLWQTGRLLWGLEAAANYTFLSIDARDIAGGTANLITDAYSLGGTTPPQAPYFGTFEGPVPGGPNRPVIGDIPTRSVAASTAQGQRSLDADLFGFRLGPSLGIPLTQRLGLSFSGGLALVSVQSDFEFKETLTNPGAGGNLVRSGTASDSDFLVGGYVAGNISYAFTEAWSVFVGAQYQNVGTYSQQVSDKEVEVDLRKSVFVSAGLGYSF